MRLNINKTQKPVSYHKSFLSTASKSLNTLKIVIYSSNNTTLVKLKEKNVLYYDVTNTKPNKRYPLTVVQFLPLVKY